jgi:sugar-specific transcriptional regulator TrmB
MYEQNLMQAGLTKGQAEVYSALIKNGPLIAARAAKLTTLSRPLAYRTLEELIRLGLAEKKEEKGKVAIFEAAHPTKLHEVIQKKKEELAISEESLESVLGQMVSDFSSFSTEPGIRFLPGKRGLEIAYDDIIKTKQDIRLIRSLYDDTVPEIFALVEQQIERQRKNDIHVRAITPIVEETEKVMNTEDKKNLVERRIIPKEQFPTTAQIILYGQKAAITVFQGHLFTTIIENAEVSETLGAMFEYIWEKTPSPYL